MGLKWPPMKNRVSSLKKKDDDPAVSKKYPQDLCPPNQSPSSCFLWYVLISSDQSEKFKQCRFPAFWKCRRDKLYHSK